MLYSSNKCKSAESGVCNLRFQTRLILTHFFLVLVLTSVLGLFFRNYGIEREKDIAYLDLQVISENSSHQLDMMVHSMQLVGDYLISDIDTLNSINVLANPSRSSLAQVYAVQAKRDIRLSLATYYIEDNFYRVSVFNANGDFITHSTSTDAVPDIAADPARFPDIDRINLMDSVFVLSAPHPDTWTVDNPETVISMTRAFLAGNTLTYIEVQKLQQDLQNVLAAESSRGYRIAIVDKDGRLFYSELSDEQNNIITANIVEGMADSKILQNQLKKHDGSVASTYYSPMTSLHVITVLSLTSMATRFSYINNLTITIIIATGFISIIVISISSARLTAPIRSLTKRMKEITLDTIVHDSNADQPRNDEIALMNQAYNQMLERLNQSAVHEKHLATLQLQAEFDALQAQVDPHFIYNVLNTISYRGVLTGDDTTCELCGNLASMLRYSTGTSKRLVRIQEEIKYVRNYLFLLQARYQEKLEYILEIDPEIENVQLPKTVLQQVVENSVKHGFKDSPTIMRLSIKGYIKDEYWYLEVCDNGVGFHKMAIEKLEQKLLSVREKIGVSTIQEDMEIGGLGLVNCYARMLLLFKDDFIFKFSNNSGNLGATVVIGAGMNKEASL